jgi:hypothetical protein
MRNMPGQGNGKKSYQPKTNGHAGPKTTSTSTKLSKEEIERRKKQSADRIAAAVEARKASKEPPKPENPVLAQVVDLIETGALTRRLTWKEKRKLRRIEKAVDAVRTAISDAFDGEELAEDMERAATDLAMIEVIARLLMLRTPGKAKKKEDDKK